MRVGEGLVGTIAAQGKVINTADAQSHPNFRYFPETGEEIYHSFLGVPILRAGRVVGVLTVQNRARRAYAEDEIEAMQIIASILAEMFGSGELIDQTKYADVAADAPAHAPAGRACGWSRGWRSAMPGCTSRGSRSPACWPRTRRPSWRGWSGRSASCATSLDQMLATSDLVGGEQREVLEAYRMFAQDTRLAAPDPRGDRHRPLRRGGGAARAGGDPGPDRRTPATPICASG